MPTTPPCTCKGGPFGITVQNCGLRPSHARTSSLSLRSPWTWTDLEPGRCVEGILPLEQSFFGRYQRTTKMYKFKIRSDDLVQSSLSALKAALAQSIG